MFNFFSLVEEGVWFLVFLTFLYRFLSSNCHVTPIITLFIQLSGHVNNFACKSPPLLSHPVAQKSTRQGESFDKRCFEVIYGNFFQRYNQFIISLGISDMCNAVQTLVAHQVGDREYDVVSGKYSGWQKGGLVGQLVYIDTSASCPIPSKME